MPGLLARSMLGEVLRTVLLTTLVLVTVIAFGATLKPLSKDSLLTPGQISKYIVLAIVPMLQFALPFAGGFAGTISMHRMAADNEIVAASTSGLSYRRVLMPVAILALVLMLLMVGLTQWVIPRFWRLLERTVAQDITRIFQASIERGEPFQLGDLQIWADDLIVETDPPGSDAQTRLTLMRVAAADLDNEGRIETDVTAREVVAHIYRRPEATYVSLVMSDTVVTNPETGTLSRLPEIRPRPRVIPTVLRDDPKRMTRRELLALRRNPDAYGPVIDARTSLASALYEFELSRQLDEQLRAAGQVELVALAGRKARVVIRADGTRGNRFTTRDRRPVEVLQYEDATPRRRMRSRSARLVHHAGGSLEAGTFTLLLSECEVTDLEYPDVANRRKSLPLENLAFEGLRVDDLSQQESADLLARAEVLGPRAAELLARPRHRLQRKLAGLQREISARLLKRYALSVTAMLLLLLGATLAIWRRHSLPLAIYLWAFLPSIADLILITSGEHLMRDGYPVTGFIVMWLGNAVLFTLLVTVYRLLSRH